MRSSWISMTEKFPDHRETKPGRRGCGCEVVSQIVQPKFGQTSAFANMAPRFVEIKERLSGYETGKHKRIANLLPRTGKMCFLIFNLSIRILEGFL